MDLLTVLMSVKNGESYLREAVESILNQTYKDFEFLIIDNASIDCSCDIVRSFNDSRIRLIELEQDIGQVRALNKGLDMIKTRYVARMYSDDISMPERFEKQLKFMENNPGVGVCGTNTIAFDENRSYKWNKPRGANYVKARLLLGCCLAHPSVIIRKVLLDKFNLRYDEKIGFSEDWELWIRASYYFAIDNIPRYLLKYRIHGESVSLKNIDARKKTDEILIQKALKPLGLNDHPDSLIHKEIAFATTFNSKNRDIDFIERVQKWIILLIKTNKKSGTYDEKSLKKALKKRFFQVLNLNTQLKQVGLKIYFKEHLVFYSGFISSVKYFIKSFF
jgi:glycosyltransferase involved in cell wall biosynthesis